MLRVVICITFLIIPLCWCQQNGQYPQNGQSPQNGQYPQNGQSPQYGQYPQNNQLPQSGQLPQDTQNSQYPQYNQYPQTNPYAPTDQSSAQNSGGSSMQVSSNIAQNSMSLAIGMNLGGSSNQNQNPMGGYDPYSYAQNNYGQIQGNAQFNAGVQNGAPNNMG